MNEHLHILLSRPHGARRHKAGRSRTDAKMHHLKDGFFDGFFAGPRAAR